MLLLPMSPMLPPTTLPPMTLDDVRMEMNEMGIDCPVFMQDNPSIHTPKLAREWLKENGWVVAKHPGYSPDLNPIEYVWAYMKRQLHKKYPHLLNMPGGPARCSEGGISRCFVRVLECYSEVTFGEPLYFYAPPCSSCYQGARLVYQVLVLHV